MTAVACGSSPDQSGTQADPIQVTGSSVPPTPDGDQSETATAVVNTETFRYVLVTYNDMTEEVTNKFLQYTPTTRSIFYGASLAGWSISIDGGFHFDYGGKVRPPTGWAVLWGDPAMTVARTDQRYAFISNIAIPDSKFPPSGRIDGAVNSFLGGACILRSSDYGKSFTASAADCVTNNGAFYDGGSMVSDAHGAIYAAFVNADANTIEVWRAPSVTGAFVRLPDPLTGVGPITSHPRLRYDVWSDRVYVMSQGAVSFVPNELLNNFTTIDHSDAIGQLLMDYYESGNWHGAQVVAPDALLDPAIPIDTSDPLGFVRTGPQFNFDVGDESVNTDDAIRVAYTARRSNGTRQVKTVRCTRNLSCAATPEWSTTGLSGNQWGPDVRTQLHFATVPSVWKLSYTSTAGQSGMHVAGKQGTLAVIGTGARTFLEFALGDPNRVVCPDNRGYWGDYDTMDVLSASLQTGAVTFFRARSSSESVCNFRWQFTSDPLHVDGVIF